MVGSSPCPNQQGPNKAKTCQKADSQVGLDRRCSQASRITGLDWAAAVSQEMTANDGVGRPHLLLALAHSHRVKRDISSAPSRSRFSSAAGGDASP